MSQELSSEYFAGDVVEIPVSKIHTTSRVDITEGTETLWLSYQRE